MADEESLNRLRDKVRRKLLKRMLEDLENDEDSDDLRNTAEAYAWITAPQRPRRGGTEDEAQAAEPSAARRAGVAASAQPGHTGDDAGHTGYGDVVAWDE